MLFNTSLSQEESDAKAGNSLPCLPTGLLMPNMSLFSSEFNWKNYLQTAMALQQYQVPNPNQNIYQALSAYLESRNRNVYQELMDKLYNQLKPRQANQDLFTS